MSPSNDINTAVHLLLGVRGSVTQEKKSTPECPASSGASDKSQFTDKAAEIEQSPRSENPQKYKKEESVSRRCEGTNYKRGDRTDVAFSHVSIQRKTSDSNTRKKGPDDQGPVKYDRAQRKAALQRYREKKKRRRQNSRSVIRYDIRKKLADMRPRYKGRFSKPSTAPAPKPNLTTCSTPCTS